MILDDELVTSTPLLERLTVTLTFEPVTVKIPKVPFLHKCLTSSLSQTVSKL